MNRSRLVGILKSRSRLLALAAMTPLAVIILGLTACVEHPIGDPEMSKVDPRYSGVWHGEQDDDATLMFLRPFDARTFLMKVLSYERKNGVVHPSSEGEWKAWLTPLGGATFLTMEPLDLEQFAGLKEEDPIYLIMKINLTDDSLTMRMIEGNNSAVREASNRREMEAVIRKNVDSEKLYGSPALVFKRPVEPTLIRSVLKAFEPREPAAELR